MPNDPTREDIEAGLARGGYVWNRKDANGIDLYVHPERPADEIPIAWDTAVLQDLWDTLIDARYIPV